MYPLSFSLRNGKMKYTVEFALPGIIVHFRHAVILLYNTLNALHAKAMTVFSLPAYQFAAIIHHWGFRTGIHHRYHHTVPVAFRCAQFNAPALDLRRCLNSVGKEISEEGSNSG